MISTHQFIRTETRLGNKYCPASFVEKGHQIIATTKNNVIVFDKDTSEIESMMLSDVKYGPVKFNLYRAPTDNDRAIRNQWDDKYLRFAKANTRNYEIKDNELIFEIDISSPKSYCFVVGKEIYRFTEKGVEVSFEYEQNDKQYFAYLPRIGLSLDLDSKYENLKYKAYGPYETYADLYKHMIKDTYESKVKDEYYHYVKPQESGSHVSPDFVEVSDGKNTLCAYGMRSFSCIDYSIVELTTVGHDFDLQKDGKTHLNLDFYMSGIGTNSCGPLTEEYARVPQAGSGVIKIESK